MTRALLAGVCVLAAAGCSLGDEPSASQRVDRCVERLLSRASPEDLAAERRPFAERYVRETYCERFQREGWVYDDGTLSIDAHRWAVGGGESECAVAVEPGEPPSDEPCPESEQPAFDPMLDCALLHHVPRSEVEAYVAELPRRHALVCDDGTPLDELGAK